jgi:hypothetical protein
MVGHKLGEFAPTRTFRGHAADKKTLRRRTSRSCKLRHFKTARISPQKARLVADQIRGCRSDRRSAS